MNYYPEIHARSASAEVAVRPDEFRLIRGALSYASRVILDSDIPVDVASSSLTITCPGEPDGVLFYGVEASQGMEITSQQIVDGDATLSLTIFGDDPHKIRKYQSIPEGSNSTSTTTFIELFGPNQDLINTYESEHIAVLMDQLLGTHQFSQEARVNADQPFQQFVSGVMKYASRFAKDKRTEQQYRGDLLDIGSGDLRELIDATAKKRNQDSQFDFLDHLQHTEATLAIVRSGRRAPSIRSTLSAPVTISQYSPSVLDKSAPAEPTTLQETFEVVTPLVNPKHHRALIRPLMSAKLQLENRGAPLARPDDLYMYAKNAADHAQPVSYVYRSLQILNDHKELGLVARAIGRSE